MHTFLLRRRSLESSLSAISHLPLLNIPTSVASLSWVSPSSRLSIGSFTLLIVGSSIPASQHSRSWCSLVSSAFTHSSISGLHLGSHVVLSTYSRLGLNIGVSPWGSSNCGWSAYWCRSSLNTSIGCSLVCDIGSPL